MRKFTINFADNALEVIEKLRRAQRQDNMAQVLRDVIGFYYWAYQQHLNGTKLVLLDASGNPTEEILLPWHFRPTRGHKKKRSLVPRLRSTLKSLWEKDWSFKL